MLENSLWWLNHNTVAETIYFLKKLDVLPDQSKSLYQY